MNTDPVARLDRDIEATKKLCAKLERQGKHVALASLEGLLSDFEEERARLVAKNNDSDDS